MLFKGVVIGLYFLVILWAGIRGLKKTRSFLDFFLGGGNVGAWMSAFTYATAYFSAVIFIGFAGSVGWNFGLSGLWIALGNAFIGVLCVWMLMGRAIKRMAMEYNVFTMAEFFEKRYQSSGLRLFTACVIFVFFIPYSCAVFMGLSYLFQFNFGISYPVALLTMGGATAMYMVLGGYRSMAILDIFFGMVMAVGVFILIGFVFYKGGGLGRMVTDLSAIDPGLVAVVAPGKAWSLFCLVFVTSIAPFAMPQLVQKFYAIRDERAIRIGTVASTIFALSIGSVAYFTGASTRLFLNPANAPNAFSDGKPVFDALMPELFANVIPPSLSVVILLLVLSASISTLAALVLISSSAVVKDFYAGFIKKNASDYRLTLYMRYGNFCFITIAVLLAFLKPSSILAMMAISWGAIGSAFLGPFVWGLFWKKATKGAAYTAGITGLVLCLGLYVSGFSSPESGTIGMMASLSLVPLVNWIFVGKENASSETV